MALFSSNLRYKMKIAGDFISSATSTNSTLFYNIYSYGATESHTTASVSASSTIDDCTIAFS